MPTRRIDVVKNILATNEQIAEENASFLKTKNIFSVNIMASPGSGKTSFILKTISEISPEIRIAVLEGDTAPVTIDADKITNVGRQAVQINTGGDCHLDANMVQQGIKCLDVDRIDLLFVENVGNLVCPGSFKLGTSMNLVIASIPEGDDKPYKYPNIYRGIDALILNKIDLKPYVDFDVKYFKDGIIALNRDVDFFDVSCKTGEGFDQWIRWLEHQVQR